MAAFPPPDDPLPAPLAVRLSGVDKTFGTPGARTIALRRADFDARLGELMMLVGPSGCGKTTLLSILAGTLAPDAGKLNVLGYRLAEMSQSELTQFRRRHVGFIFQQFNLIPTLSVWENVAVPLLKAAPEETRRRERASCSPPSACEAARKSARENSPAASSNASPSPARSCTGRPSLSATSPPAPSTARAASR